MSEGPASTETWLGPLPGVEERVRRELEQILIKDADGRWLESPPTDLRVRSLAQDLVNLHEAIRPAFLKWWRDGVIDNAVSIEGHTVLSIQSELALRTPLVAFTWLDGLAKEPAVATERLSQARRGPKIWRIRSEPLN